MQRFGVTPCDVLIGVTRVRPATPSDAAMSRRVEKIVDMKTAQEPVNGICIAKLN